MDTLAHPHDGPTAPRTAAPRRLRLLPPDPDLGWTPYVWLIYLATFLVAPFFHLRNGTMTPAHAAATVLGLL
ncbi:MAG TPA: hypothetical protein VFQ45_07805, partial [Longimicrobium sp.]|nr:hypothetical protein [Longimicrobium sp.]